jgi:hypothetical protein
MITPASVTRSIAPARAAISDPRSTDRAGGIS